LDYTPSLFFKQQIILKKGNIRCVSIKIYEQFKGHVTKQVTTAN